MSTCPQCSRPLPDPSARFCPYCGAPLGAAPSASAVPPASEPAPAAPNPAIEGRHCALHPDRSAVNVCSRCGNFVCNECLVVSTTGAPHCITCEQRGEVDNWRVPWENREKLGLFQGYWQTVKAVMLNPGVSFPGLAPSTGQWWHPISFAIVCAYLGNIGTILFYAVAFGLGGLAAALDKTSGGKGVGAIEGLMGGFYILAFLVGTPLWALAVTFVIGGLEHLMLRLFGVNTRGYEATIRARCYAMAPQIIGVIPLCGYWVHLFWEIVCRIFGYQGVHRTSGGKATAGVLVPMLSCCVCGVGGYLLFFAALFSSFGSGIR